MCGFFASNDPSITKDSEDIINSRLAFRGPDGQSGMVFHKDWKLYHSRLSIIAPVEKFSQPFFSKTGNVLVFNGEILNFRELSIKYNIDQTDSDTEALNELLSIDGFDINELEGFFAFARFNRQGDITHCARDRFGVKPLYFHKRGDYISISSEASALSDLFKLDYEESALEEYKVFRAPVFSGSYFKDIQTVEPGTCLISGTFFDCKSYFTNNYINESEVSNKIHNTILDSLKSRLISDVPVGLLYSGGIDSNLLNEVCEEKLQKFTGGFSGDYDLELARNNNNSNHDNTILVEVSREKFKKRFFEMTKLRKEPLSVPNEVILSFLAEKWANMGGKVLISGEAADEFFGGYDRIYGWALRAENFEIDKFLEFYCYVPIDKIPDRIVKEVNDFFEPLQSMSPFEMVRYFFVKKHLPILFRRLDFSLMFSGIEGREPLASLNMFLLALKCNPNDLFEGALGKLPLRNLAKELISEEFAFSTKVGFPVDLGLIFREVPSKDKYENYQVWYDENIGAII